MKKTPKYKVGNKVFFILADSWRLERIGGIIFGLKKSFFRFKYLIEYRVEYSEKGKLIGTYETMKWIKEKNILRLIR
jgi:hypothetical protein